MKKIIILSLFIITAITFHSCGIYSFTGGDTGNAKTIQIDYFPNTATLVEPELSQKFTQDLQDLFLTQTNLTSVKSNGDLQFEGEITGYRINPMGATAEQKTSQNRLTITVNCRFYNKEEESKNFEKSFSFYADYPANKQLTGSILDDAFTTILERITQDIFNASVANW
ncbi:MAG: LptE family protein [Flavobacteriaceae bacterium]|nr:LptE family protein [Flavobacteriaceae bacterium]